MLKYSLMVLFALVIASLTFMGMQHVINQPAVINQEKEPQHLVAFVDISFDQTETKCQAVTEEIRDLLNTPQTCNTAADCTFAHFGCPFGCRSVVNISNEQAIHNLVSYHNKVCQVRCNYRCKKDEIKRIPACIENLCRAIEAIDTDKAIDQFIEENHPFKQ
ncbi:MAG: hypothetical protein R3E90_09325 [Marinicella sp.]|nr:hypothetical protein [Xanthomonadales bacterium]